MQKIIFDRLELIKRYLNNQQNILDIGCNEGTYHQELKKINNNIVGFDINNFNDNTIIKGDIDSNWIFTKEYFDYIIAGEVIEHIKYPYKMLENCYKSLKKNGILLITTPNARTFNYNWNQLKENNEHIHCWDLTLMKRIIKKAGFEIIEEGYISSRKTGWFMRLIRDKCWHCYVVCQKNGNQLNK